MSNLKEFIKKQNKDEYLKYGKILSDNPVLFEIIDDKKIYSLFETLRLKWLDCKTEKDFSHTIYEIISKIENLDDDIFRLILFNFLPKWKNNNFKFHPSNKIKTVFDSPGIFLANFFLLYEPFGNAGILIQKISNGEKILIDKFFLKKIPLGTIINIGVDKFIIEAQKSIKNFYCTEIISLVEFYANDYDLNSLHQIKNLIKIDVNIFLKICLYPPVNEEIINILFSMIDKNTILSNDYKEYEILMDESDRKFIYRCLERNNSELKKIFS